MSDDPDTPNSKKLRRAAPGEGRDKRGRWIMGHCPNPNGRPKKERLKNYNPADPIHFFATEIEVMTADGPQKMDREAALLLKLFETGMKGGVTAQRMMFEMIEKNSERLATLRLHYDRRLRELVFDNPDFKNLAESLTTEEHIELLAMARLLNNYFPGQFSMILGEDESDYLDHWEERLAARKARKSEE